ncbi:GtrA family protein [Bremerella sp. P1]|uniref:GtrA family protein n=1 Tax=Bremerella sp. P1 TaxID=3026424 RepID=UPI0023688D0C|nr:GtrA family protein [Bremerella sp. P1]WDI43841.1 GtrA family protein [Bremerella sp. P1]
MESPNNVLQWLRRQTILSHWYRFRYLIGFILIGMASICLELAVMNTIMPESWPRLGRASAALVFGIVFGYILNAKLNFQVAPKYLLSTFTKYSVVSVSSFALNMTVISYVEVSTDSLYWVLRLGTAAALFSFAYTLHRYFTFDQARNLGVAVYAASDEDVGAIFDSVGDSCDHIHVDLVDETMGDNPAPVNVFKLQEARKYWPHRQVALHLMTRQPSRWLDRVWNDVDWVLFHLEIEEDLNKLIFQCRQHGKKVGVVWRVGNDPADLLPFLNHVDFIMVLGIAKPGQSGQEICKEAIDLVAALNSMRSKYNFELMFDGGVNSSTISQIEAKYVVSASAILRAENPILAVDEIRRRVQYPNKAAA